MPSSVTTIIPKAELVGEARMTFLFWDVCDIQLFAQNGTWNASEPYALRLQYLRKFKGEAIAKRSVNEMREQGLTDEATLNQWLNMMMSIFPDVTPGSQLTGVLDETGVTTFFAGEEKIAVVEDTRFGPHFFAIWLGDKTSDPKLRAALIGES